MDGPDVRQHVGKQTAACPCHPPYGCAWRVVALKGWIERVSTHVIEIVEIDSIEPHPNADRMELTHLWGWQCCIGKGQFKPGDRAVYIPPDYLVPLHRPEFAFLRKDEKKTQERIRVRRFRGLYSQGLLISVPPQLADRPVGSDVMADLQIERYEPPLPKTTGGDFVPGPSGLYSPKFDVESYQRYRHLFTPGEEVVITEKLHGASARYVYAKQSQTKSIERGDAGISADEWVQFCGSRTHWIKDDETNIWWMAFRQNPAIGQWCRANPERILYGEVFGQVQGLKYGAGRNDVFFAAFSVLDKLTWLDHDVFAASIASMPGLPTVPVLYRGPFDEKQALALAEEDSSWASADHMREGVVVLPIHERMDPEIGRVILKMVGNRYIEGN